MVLPQIISRNTINVIPDQSNSGNPTTIGTTPFVLYTVPAGRKAILKTFVFRATGFGAGTTMQAVANGINLLDTSSTSNTMVNALVSSIILAAGQTVTLKGDSGSNNESAFFFITFQELPA